MNEENGGPNPFSFKNFIKRGDGSSTSQNGGSAKASAKKPSSKKKSSGGGGKTPPDDEPLFPDADEPIGVCVLSCLS